MLIWRELLLALWMFGLGGAPVVMAHPDEAAEITEAGPGQSARTTNGRQPCDGILTQGGLILCHGEPGTIFSMGATRLEAGADGRVHFGLSRAAPAHVNIRVIPPVADALPAEITLPIAPRHDEESVISGIDCDKIDARTEAQKAHAGASWVKKQDAWKIFHTGYGASTGFRRPAEGRISSPFGYIRKYVTEGCETKIKPHFGYDIAAPTGAPVIAPASGTVILADDDLYYEGGTVFLDHGGGLVSLFLHMSKLNVNVGDVIEAGDLVGEVGATGRVTGAHLHWAVKWRNPDTDDRSGDFYIDPGLLLELPRTE